MPRHEEQQGRWWRTRLAGLLAGGLALSILWVVSRINPTIGFAPILAGDALIRATPGGFATFMIESLGHLAQILLAFGVVVAYLGLAAVLPERTGSRGELRPLFAGGALFVALSLPQAFVPLAPALPIGLLTSLLAAVIYVLAFRRLERFELVGAEPDPARRQALWTVGSAAAGLVLGGTLIGRLGSNGGRDQGEIVKAARPATIPARPAFPEIAGMQPEVTSVADHYVVDINLTSPRVDSASWLLEIGGEVERPLTLDYAQLQGGFPVVEEYSVLTCISNEVGGPLIGNSKWTGVRLPDVLDEVGVDPSAVDLKLTCADGYTVGVPIEQARDRSAILAIGQNGQPLTMEHGFPCRLRIPALYGMLNAKWLQRIEVVSYDYKGYWAERGWLDVAFVRTQSRIDVAGPVVAVGAPTWIAGVAWAGNRGVARVEVSTDAGESWDDAELRRPISELAWVQWAFPWTPDRPGTHEVACRATDGDGRVQDAQIRPPHPSGATGYPAVRVGVS